jgi:hypothetical protein
VGVPSSSVRRVILPGRVADAVARGEVTLAFRRWPVPRVKPGQQFLTSAGIVEVRTVEQVDPESLTEADALAAGHPALAALQHSTRRDGPLFRIGLAWAGPDPRVALRETADLSAADVVEVSERLARLDRRGAWTHEVLRTIRDQPGRLAAELAAERGEETQPFKINVRRLKALGLTHSLPIGYELSPRGRAYLAQLPDA